MLFSLFGLSIYDFFYLVLYISGQNSFPRPLSAELEHELLEKKMQGDTLARNELIEKNMRLVAHIIKKYYSNYSEQEDLISIGTIGLIKAVDSFNLNKGARLATYASRCIENEILMHFRNNKKNGILVSIDDPIDIDKNGNALTLMDILPSEDTIIDDIDIRIKLKKLKNILGDVLDVREMSIIILRYGLGMSRPLTQMETANKLGISRSYVSRIEKTALNVLKNKLNDK
ncbi:MAG: RNA polymerase sporulation sigma factor SigK [Clostridia bacterium]